MTRQSKTAELCLISTEQSPCYGWVEGLMVTRTQTPGGTRSCVPSANHMPASATDTAPVPAEITVHPRRIREEQRTVRLGRERKPPRNGGRRSTEAELGTGWTGRRELPPSRKQPGAVRPHTARRNDKDKDTEPGRPGCVGPVGACLSPEGMKRPRQRGGAALRGRRAWRPGGPRAGQVHRRLLTASASHFSNSHDVSDSHSCICSGGLCPAIADVTMVLFGGHREPPPHGTASSLNTALRLLLTLRDTTASPRGP